MPFSIDADTLAHLQSWQGKRETAQDTVTATPLSALAATLDWGNPPAFADIAVPPLWHWLYFLPHAPACALGVDGHPQRGGFLPPVPLPRRMWAGGRLRWQHNNPLRVGQPVERLSIIRSVTHKAGRSGDLLFVLVEHCLSNANGWVLTEEHDIVYRPMQTSDALHVPGQLPPLAGQAKWLRTIIPDAVLLFRYSALTFNAHRIHYDRKYVTEVEGYPGLVVHGPLIATFLLNLIRQHKSDAVVTDFEFKAVRPMFDLHAFGIYGKLQDDGKTIDLWAQDHDGWLTMQATAHIV